MEAAALGATAKPSKKGTLRVGLSGLQPFETPTSEALDKTRNPARFKRSESHWACNGSKIRATQHPEKWKVAPVKLVTSRKPLSARPRCASAEERKKRGDGPVSKSGNGSAEGQPLRRSSSTPSIAASSTGSAAKQSSRAAGKTSEELSRRPRSIPVIGRASALDSMFAGFVVNGSHWLQAGEDDDAKSVASVSTCCTQGTTSSSSCSSGSSVYLSGGSYARAAREQMRRGSSAPELRGSRQEAPRPSVRSAVVQLVMQVASALGLDRGEAKILGSRLTSERLLDISQLQKLTEDQWRRLRLPIGIESSLRRLVKIRPRGRPSSAAPAPNVLERVKKPRGSTSADAVRIGRLDNRMAAQLRQYKPVEQGSVDRGQRPVSRKELAAALERGYFDARDPPRVSKDARREMSFPPHRRKRESRAG